MKGESCDSVARACSDLGIWWAPEQSRLASGPAAEVNLDRPCALCQIQILRAPDRCPYCSHQLSCGLINVTTALLRQDGSMSVHPEPERCVASINVT